MDDETKRRAARATVRGILERKAARADDNGFAFDAEAYRDAARSLMERPAVPAETVRSGCSVAGCGRSADDVCHGYGVGAHDFIAFPQPDLATIQADAHGAGQENAEKEIAKWLRRCYVRAPSPALAWAATLIEQKRWRHDNDPLNEPAIEAATPAARPAGEAGTLPLPPEFFTELAKGDDDGMDGDPGPDCQPGAHLPTCRRFGENSSAAPTPGKAADDTEPREPGCQCHLEAGDSPCRIHGEEKSDPGKAADEHVEVVSSSRNKMWSEHALNWIGTNVEGGDVIVGRALGATIDLPSSFIVGEARPEEPSAPGKAVAAGEAMRTALELAHDIVVCAVPADWHMGRHTILCQGAVAGIERRDATWRALVDRLRAKLAEARKAEEAERQLRNDSDALAKRALSEARARAEKAEAALAAFMAKETSALVLALGEARDLRAALAASVSKENVVRWLNWKSDRWNESGDVGASVAACELADQIDGGSWLRDLTTMDARPDKETDNG